MNLRELKNSIMNKWPKIRVAHQAVMVEDARKQLKQYREKNQNHERGSLEEDERDEMTDDDGMIIADNISIGDKTRQSLATTLLALATGMGGGYVISDLLSKEEPSVVQSDAKPAISPDVDTKYELKAIPGE